VTIAHDEPPGAEPQPEPAQSPRLRANRDFQLVLGGQGVSALGDAVTLTAMPLLVLFLTGSGALMGLVGALQFLPNLVLGLPAGALADRWDRRRLMLWSDIGRTALTAAIPVSFWLGWPTMAVVLIVTVPINALRVLSDAAFASAVPNLVGREHLARANSYLEATLSVPFIVGPAIAGVLVAVVGAPTTLAIDAVTFAVSAASLSLVRRPLRAERPGEMPHILTDIKEGIRFVWGHFVLRTIISYFSVIAMATAALIPALSYYITIDRGYGPELFGFAGSTWSLGYLLGSLLGGRLGRARVGLRMLVCSVVIGASLVVTAVTTVSLVYLVATFLIGAALAVQLVSYMTLRALITPDELLGRVSSVSRTVTVGLQPLGMLAGGALIDASSGGTTLMAMGGVAIVASVVFGLSRTFRELGYAEAA
jgi:MFS family permease